MMCLFFSIIYPVSGFFSDFSEFSSNLQNTAAMVISFIVVDFHLKCHIMTFLQVSWLHHTFSLSFHIYVYNKKLSAKIFLSLKFYFLLIIFYNTCTFHSWMISSLFHILSLYEVFLLLPLPKIIINF